MKVTADDVTKILVISGGAAVSGGKAGVGGSVQVDVILKTVQALIADGTGGCVCSNLRSGRTDRQSRFRRTAVAVCDGTWRRKERSGYPVLSAWLSFPIRWKHTLEATQESETQETAEMYLSSRLTIC